MEKNYIEQRKEKQVPINFAWRKIPETDRENLVIIFPTNIEITVANTGQVTKSMQKRTGIVWQAQIRGWDSQRREKPLHTKRLSEVKKMVEDFFFKPEKLFATTLIWKKEKISLNINEFIYVMRLTVGDITIHVAEVGNLQHEIIMQTGKMWYGAIVDNESLAISDTTIHTRMQAQIEALFGF